MNHKIFKLLLVAILLFIFVLFVIPSVFNSGGVVAADLCSLQIFEGLGQKSPVTSEKGVQSKVTFLQDASSPVSNESNIKNNLSNYDIQYHKPTEDIIKDSDIELSSNFSNGGYLAEQSPSSYNYSPPNYVPNYEDTVYFSKLTGLGYHTPISPSDLKSPSSTTVYSPAPSAATTPVLAGASPSVSAATTTTTTTVVPRAPEASPSVAAVATTTTAVPGASGASPSVATTSTPGIRPYDIIPPSYEASPVTSGQIQIQIPTQLQIQMPVSFTQVR